MSRKILVYGDVNLNYRDGSGAWLIALANCLLLTNSEVHVLLKADVTDPAKLSGLETLPAGHLHSPQLRPDSGRTEMTQDDAVTRISELDKQLHFDIVITRGSIVAGRMALSGEFTGRMWPYWTEGPSFSFNRTPAQEDLLDRIAQESRRIFVQTEEARSIVESLNAGMSQKVLVMNPIVPDEAFRDKAGSVDSTVLSMAYAGKFARLWNTLQMTELPGRLATAGFAAKLHMIGDKFQNTGGDHDWLAEMKGKAELVDERIVWHGGLPRSQVLDIVYQADIGMCWRDGQLDSSPEISTKMLECAALGTPPILNRTAMHERLLGADYPLFIDNGDPLSVLKQAAEDPTIIERARRVSSDAVRDYSASATAARFTAYFERSEGGPEQGRSMLGRKHRVVVAGHDFKFAADLIETLKQRKDLEVRIDKWRRLSDHDQEASLAAAEWADTVICEWAGPNSVFYSQHLSEDKRLLVRFHGFEVRGQWLDDLEMERVDALVFVSDFYRREVIEKLGWSEDKTTVIPNTIDIADLDRPKVADARFNIGMAGYVPFLKRPDRAVALLRKLVHADERFHLYIRGRAPWHYQWEWEKASGRDAYEAFFASIARDPLLRDRVTFEPFFPDMGNWFRKIGWMVSPSTRETFHLAPIEGMASGAPALVWNRDGADEIFGEDIVHANLDDIAEYVINNSTAEKWAELSLDAKVRAQRYDLVHSRQRWSELLNLPVGEAPPLYGTSILEDGGSSVACLEAKRR